MKQTQRLIDDAVARLAQQQSEDELIDLNLEAVVLRDKARAEHADLTVRICAEELCKRAWRKFQMLHLSGTKDVREQFEHQLVQAAMPRLETKERGLHWRR